MATCARLALALIAIAGCGTTRLDGVPACPDDDGDGHLSASCGGDDCDDSRFDVHPGAPEACLDGADNDCDGLTDGALLTSPALAVSAEPCIGALDLEWTGSEFGLMWAIDYTSMPGCEDRHDDYSLNFARVDAAASAAVVSPPLGTAVFTEWDEPGELAISWTGSEYGISWIVEQVNLDSFHSQLHMMRLLASGEPASDGVLLRSDRGVSGLGLVHPGSPTVAWTGSGFSLFWAGWNTTGPSTIYEVRVDPAGLVPSGDTIVGKALVQPVPSLAWTGSELGVAFAGESSDGTMQVANLVRLGLAGEIVGRASPQGDWARNVIRTYAAWSGSEYGLAWSQGWGLEEPCDIRFVRVDGTGETLGEEIVLMDAVSPEDFFHINGMAWTGLGYAVVTGDYYGSFRIASVGAAGDSVEISQMDWTGDPPRLHALEWTGSEFGLAWTDSAGLHVQRIGLCE